MKRLLIIAVLCALLFSACDRTPVIDGKTPFVVDKVEYQDSEKNMCIYTCNTSAVTPYFWNSGRKARIVAPTGAFNQGDTITFNSSLYY